MAVTPVINTTWLLVQKWMLERKVLASRRQYQYDHNRNAVTSLISQSREDYMRSLDEWMLL